ncbi:AI-2E family transporter [Falsiroseomonas tokyonensis]|uniref:AI-2E family transporter n=1 Tax=Falsiroseomonas tokyonensis TaxID=430521 RepID=A0ABV7BXY3_9PROT|nr:AI-2E family transporter [Falsiroseomonas tokyonensis]MBU8539502.1 AI-2E family transporter [Falsiroseomonas tokyonensis]
MDRGEADGAGQGRAEVAFLRRVLIVAAVVVLALLLWQVRDALLLTFGGVVVAALLLAAAEPVERHLGLSRSWSLLLVGLLIGGGLALAGMLVGSEVTAQIGQLWGRLPDAVRALEERFGVAIPALQGGGQEGAEGGGLDTSLLGTLAGHAATAGSMVVNAASALVLAVVGGFFLASSPDLYRRGVVKLLPREQHARADEALVASGKALRLWLAAQLVSMAIVGTLAGLGSWLVGLPSPLALGLFAGLAGFVPLIGAVVGALPALLLALSEGGNAFLWTGLLFLAIQQLESNMIMPLVEKHMVSMPPALMLFAVVAVGLLFGLPGVLLAAPITVVVFVLVKKLYVRETLGQPTEVPGEKEAGGAS